MHTYWISNQILILTRLKCCRFRLLMHTTVSSFKRGQSDEINSRAVIHLQSIFSSNHSFLVRCMLWGILKLNPYNETLVNNFLKVSKIAGRTDARELMIFEWTLTLMANKAKWYDATEVLLYSEVSEHYERLMFRLKGKPPFVKTKSQYCVIRNLCPIHKVLFSLGYLTNQGVC